tara:strand:+ start:533 stop:781 length:249 start_codon:yes stop_codon:yes gene_type:complete
MIDTDEPYNSSLEAAEDYQDQIDTLLAEVKRLRAILGGDLNFEPTIKDIEICWGIDFNGASITVTHYTGVMLSGELKLELIE